MATLILIFAALAAIHFVYDGIIAPSLRLDLRFRLFKLRDQVRVLRIDQGHQFTEEAYEILEGTINCAIRVLPWTNMELFWEAQRAVDGDPKLRAAIDERSRILDSCNFPEVQEIRHEINRIGMTAFQVNSAGWFIYLFPLAVWFALFARMKALIQELLLVPQAKIESLAALRQPA